MSLRILSILATSAFLAACSPTLPPASQQKSSAPAAPLAKDSASASAKDTGTAPMPAVAPAASDLAGLEEGHDLFQHRCAICHKLPVVAAHTAEKWPRIVEKMGPKAKLDSAQTRKLLAWVLAERAKS